MSCVDNYLKEIFSICTPQELLSDTDMNLQMGNTVYGYYLNFHKLLNIHFKLLSDEKISHVIFVNKKNKKYKECISYELYAKTNL